MSNGTANPGTGSFRRLIRNLRRKKEDRRVASDADVRAYMFGDGPLRRLAQRRGNPRWIRGVSYGQ